MVLPKETFKNSWIPPTLKLPKGKITKIDFKEHEQELERIWSGSPPAKLMEKWKETEILDIFTRDKTIKSYFIF